MKFVETNIPGVLLVENESLEDDRGSFLVVWNDEAFAERGLASHAVQINLSTNRKRGTLRGLHYRVPPFVEAKYVGCIRGAVYDVVLDIREGSPAYGEWVGVELSAQNRTAIYVPEGCAHAYLTLEDDSEVQYVVSQPYAPNSERGLRYNDPAFNISWPIPIEVISEKDQSWPDYRL